MKAMIRFTKLALAAMSLFILSGVVGFQASAQKKQKTSEPKPQIESHWNGARVAFLGDSITDKGQLGENDTYWNLLTDILGTVPYVYGISGHMMPHIIGQGEKLEAEHGQDVDVIMVFVGTNDYNANIPMGEWYTYDTAITNHNGIEVGRAHRTLIYDPKTFKGRTNATLKWLKTHYPTKQIILLTPLHRGFSTFGEHNIQPDETYANACGLFIDDYVEAIKEAGDVWAVPVIDLFSISGLYPMIKEQTQYFRYKDGNDMLHPNTAGHKRMAEVLARALQYYPAKLD